MAVFSRGCILFLIGVFACLGAFAQTVVKGVVYDNAGKTLPFVSVAVQHSAKGTVCDIDGKFELNLSDDELNAGLQFSYVGFEPKALNLQGKDLLHISVMLQTNGVLLGEVTVLPGENPAHRIIKEVTKNRDRNNPEKMRSFSYTSYNKMFVTTDVAATNDSLMLLDTSKLEGLPKLLKRQHLFLTESVSERAYLHPGRNSEKVVASRVSGFRHSPFTLLATQMQSFSFYNDLVDLFDLKYLNPVSSGSTKKYFFLMEDTLYQGKDTVFIISFRPKKNKNFNGLQGLLYINTSTYAIQNVIAEPFNPEGNISIKIQQQYQFIEEKQWFPVQLNTDWIYNNISVGDNSTNIGTKEVSGPRMKAISRSYIRNIVLNPELKRRQFNEVEVSIDKNADRQEESFWNLYRVDSLTLKDKKTYSTIDSIGKEANLDKKAIAFEALLTNQLQVKFLNLDLDEIMRYNEYEGYRLGLGAHTNYRVSNVFKTGGYLAYGFRDKVWKYGGDVSFRVWKKKELVWKTLYKNDVIESAGVSFFENRQSFNSSELMREFSIAKMDRIIKYQTELQFRIFKYFKTALFVNHQQRWGKTGYAPEGSLNAVPRDTFNFNEAGVQLKFLFREKFLQTLRNKISLGSDFPAVYVNVARGLKQEIAGMKGDFEYTRIDLKIEHTIIFKSIGKEILQLQAGKVLGDVPYTLLYNNKGNYFYKYGTSAQNSFETMGMNEFTSSAYAALFFSHNIGKFLPPREKFNPQLEFVHNMGIGMLDHSATIYTLGIKTMEKGYFESGIRLLNVIKSSISGIGVGAFYRYGPYQLADVKNNIALKFCLTIGF